MIQLVKGDSDWITEKIDWYSNFPLFSIRTLESWSIPRNNFSIRWCKNFLKNTTFTRHLQKRKKRVKDTFGINFQISPRLNLKLPNSVTTLQLERDTMQHLHIRRPIFSSRHFCESKEQRWSRSIEPLTLKASNLKKKKTEEEKIKKLISMKID